MHAISNSRFFLFYQHVDDHSIIMADQTVIKKGEFTPFFDYNL